jgi:hypothetical protein
VKILRILKVLAINIVTFLVLLLILNWGSGVYLKRFTKPGRHTLPNYASDQEHASDVFKDYHSIQHQYEPFVGWRMLPYKGKTTVISQDGKRSHTPPSYEQPREKTVRFFGGSTMWGEGSDDQHTIPALFNQRAPQFDVYNHGQLAYNTRQELDALITTYLQEEKTDVVIFYDGVNDAAFLCPTEISELPAHRMVPVFRQKLYVSKSAFVKEVVYKGFLENIMRLINRFSTPSGKETKGAYDCLEAGKAEEIAEMFMKDWEIAHKLVTDRGGKFVAILQPAAFIGNPRIDHLELDPELRDNFVEVYKHLRQKIAERKYDWIYDLSNKFDGNEYIFIDFCHVSPNGNEIIAEEVARIVANLDQEPLKL